MKDERLLIKSFKKKLKTFFLFFAKKMNYFRCLLYRYRQLPAIVAS